MQEASPGRGRWKLRLSKISDLLPANLELDFLMEEEADERQEERGGACAVPGLLELTGDEAKPKTEL